MSKKLKLGMVGGGEGSNIGYTHRQAAKFDNKYELVTGVFSSTAEKTRSFAKSLGIAEDRAYASYQEMLEKERARDDGIDVVAILTPNDSHYAIAKASLEQGFHVICDKPLTTNVEDAIDLVEVRNKTGLVFALTHNYSGYPMVRQARDMIKNGDIGSIKMVQIDYLSGWAASLLEAQGHKQALWRTKKESAGQSSVLGDLGSHAHQLLRFITGLELESVSAFINTIVEGRQTDDNAFVHMKLSGGVPASMWASMAATGERNAQRIRVYGDKASLEWRQEDPEELVVRNISGPEQKYFRGSEYLSLSSQKASRLWPGHPDGFMSAFANIYRDAAEAIWDYKNGKPFDPMNYIFPKVEDGLLGMKFVDASVQSHSKNGAWVSIQ